jgi:FkbM family methyltransferase
MTEKLDKFWLDTIAFIYKNTNNSDLIIANDELIQYLEGQIYDYSHLSNNLLPDFVILHKGLLENLNKAILENYIYNLKPVFANEVFAILSGNQQIKSVEDSMHYKSLINIVRNLAKNTTQQITSSHNERKAVYLGNNTILTKTIHGHKIYLDANDLSLTPHLILDGYWESWITNFFMSIVKEGMTVLDIGANVGYYTLLAASAVGPNGKVFSFEANKKISDLVFFSSHVNGFNDRVTVINKAVFSEETELEFKIYDRYKGSSGIFETQEKATLFHDIVRTEIVKTITLDSYFANDTKIDLIKIDAEGAEPFIFKGAARVLKNNPNLKIIMEFAPSTLNSNIGTAIDFFEGFIKMGYIISKINEDSTLTKLDINDVLNINHCDVFICKP